jgi:hypothetical protein
MEKKNGNGNGKSAAMCHDADHGCCCYGGYAGRHIVLRIILAVALLFLVFKMGVNFGEFKSELRGYGGQYDSHFRHHKMMMQAPTGIFVPQTAPVATPTPVKPSTTAQ